MLRVIVVGTEGKPLANQPILLVDQAGKRTLKRSDIVGVTLFDHPGDGNIIARAQGKVPVIRRVTEDRETYVLRLAQGLHIDGRLLIDGNPPGKSLTFSASVFQSGLTDRFYHALGREAYNSDLQPIPLLCDATGSFQIDGLQPGWKVRINLPNGLKMAGKEKDGGRPVYYIETVREDDVITLRTTRRTQLTGRCIDLAGRPLPDVLVELRVATRNRFGKVFPLATVRATRSDSEGRFTLYLDESPMTTRALVVGSRAGMELTHETTLHGPSRQSIADFVFPVSREVQLIVLDELGQPIAGAKVGTSDETFRRTTGSSGRVNIPLIPGRALPLQIAAPGFGFRQVSLDDKTAEELSVRLHRASRTTLHFLWDDGSPMAEQFVALRFRQSPFMDERAFSSPIHRAAYPSIRMDVRNGLFCASTKTDNKGVVVLDDLRPGQSIRIIIPGCAGTTLLDTDRVVPEGDMTKLQFVLSTQRTTRLGVIVYDSLGNPLSDSTVAIGHDPGNLGVAGYTDERGRLEIRDIAFESAYVRAGKVGFGSIARFIESIRHVEGDLEFRLKPAARCRLLVKDADGRLMEKAYVGLPRVHSPGMGPVVTKQGPGTFEIVDLGDEPCIATVYGPG
ncbi:MAG TPA: carboxypeptidase regulatory-like domain-containing protein, partial [Planctomycetes bacterium]|nr:carboxypeptidase regulatory-like domain-containing protein [Planctomycetota bacterium]